MIKAMEVQYQEKEKDFSALISENKKLVAELANFKNALIQEKNAHNKTKGELSSRKNKIEDMENQYNKKEESFKRQIEDLHSKLEELSKRKDYNDGYEKGYDEGYNRAKEYIDNINELTEDLMEEIETLKKKCKVYEDRIINDQVTIRAYRDKGIQISEEDFRRAGKKFKEENLKSDTDTDTTKKPENMSNDDIIEKCKNKSENATEEDKKDQEAMEIANGGNNS